MLRTRVAIAVPAGPRSPCGPRSPAAPRSPGAPRSPCAPASPFGPGAPGRPAGPRGPRRPRGPRTTLGFCCSPADCLPDEMDCFASSAALPAADPKGVTPRTATTSAAAESATGMSRPRSRWPCRLFDRVELDIFPSFVRLQCTPLRVECRAHAALTRGSRAAALCLWARAGRLAAHASADDHLHLGAAWQPGAGPAALPDDPAFVDLR
jgi:hypothetical protein